MPKGFVKFINEDDSKLTHLTHVEDRVIDHGSQGYDHAITHLYALHDKLKGRRLDRTDTSVKQDGAPAIIAGYHPENGKFFIGTKSIFNKTPKINYTPADIDKNHGHAPGLVAKLKDGLKHLPKVMPKRKIYQGDFMYSKGDVKLGAKAYKFKPNTIEYSTPKDSAEGKKISKAKIGISFHTGYKSDTGKFEDLKAHFNPDVGAIKKHKDVHVISHHYDFDDPEYEAHHYDGFKKHMAAAKKIRSGMADKEFNLMQRHSGHLNMYINHRVRTSENPDSLDLSHDGYREWLKDRSETAKSGTARNQAIGAYHQSGYHPEAFNRAFALHHELTRAKETLIHVLNRKQSYGHSIGGIESTPEGYVDTFQHGGKTIPSKLVQRQTFSRNNFIAGKPG
jgi:hypothetical protein